MSSLSLSNGATTKGTTLNTSPLSSPRRQPYSTPYSSPRNINTNYEGVILSSELSVWRYSIKFDFEPTSVKFQVTIFGFIMEQTGKIVIDMNEIPKMICCIFPSCPEKLPMHKEYILSTITESCDYYDDALFFNFNMNMLKLYTCMRVCKISDKIWFSYGYIDCNNNYCWLSHYEFDLSGTLIEIISSHAQKQPAILSPKIQTPTTDIP